MERNYYAKELVVFAKQDREKSESGKYLLIGYFNSDKTKFKNLESGRVFSVSDGRVIEVEGQTFLNTDIKIEKHDGVNENRYLKFSTECVFSKVTREPFMEVVGKVGYPYLYHFVEKHNATPNTVVSAVDILRATKEADFFAEQWLTGWNDKENRPRFEQVSRIGYPSLTEEEREF